MRERQVAAYAGLGRSAKEISYLLGAPAASVENSLRRAQAKLGLQSRVELTDFFAPRSLRAHVAEIAVGNETLLVGSMPLLDETKLVGLSPAERHVLALVIAGSTDHDIAKRIEFHGDFPSRAVAPVKRTSQLQRPPDDRGCDEPQGQFNIAFRRPR